MRASFISFLERNFAFTTWNWVAFFVLIVCGAVLGQERAQAPSVSRPLITEALDEAQLTTLRGNIHPLARRESDLGTAPASLPMERMLLVLKRSPERETALRKMLDNQQDKHSPSYHKWVTPEQFGQQFGPTDADLQSITGWLQSHGFQVGATKGRTVLEFSGSASQVQEAFHTTIHKYIVKGEQHWANASDPQIPTALAPAVAGVLTLHNFIKKPALHFSGEPIPATFVPGKKPQVTFPAQGGQQPVHALAPVDYAVIYNIKPLYDVDNVGNGTSIAVVGRSNLFNNGEDVTDFDNTIGSGNAFNSAGVNIVLNGPDPGDLGGGEEAEATLDSTWSGAIAPGATVYLVVSATTNTTDGIDLSETYIVENNLADVMTESFSACELYATDTQLAGASALAEQAAAQGITYVVSAGDNGADGCDDPNFAPAANPISVNYLASTAFNVAVGGTTFNENGDAAKYWTSTPPISETAISYIPENVWNESSLANGLWSGSGGASAGNIQSGAGITSGVPKPSWQYGLAGIPNDGVRDLPDVSLTAASHDPYLLCFEGSCVPNSQGQLYVYFFSGTSASAPSFAGIMALLGQAASLSRQGLPNFILYRLAAAQAGYPSQCNGSNTVTPPATNCIFNDITVGNNVVPGEPGTEFQAGTGYDLTTGLGSVNVGNLYANWGTVTFNPTTTALTLNGGTTVNITHGQSIPVLATVSPNTGTGTPTGDLVLLTANSLLPSTMQTFALNGGQVISSTNQLPGGGGYTVSARYGGDATYAPSDSNGVIVTVNPEPSTTALSVLTADSNGNLIPFASGPFGSFIYLRADVAGQSGNGVATGTATFSDAFGAIPGGSTFTLNAQGNTATPNGIFNFDTGTHTISAIYSGDASFSPSTTSQSQTFTITPGYYASVPSGQSTIVIAAPGDSGTSSVTVVNSSGFRRTIALACSGLPSEAMCTFTPPSIQVSGIAGTTTATIVIATKAKTASAMPGPRRYWLAQSMIGIGVLFSAVLMGGKQQRMRGLFLLLMLALLLGAPACGGGSSKPSPPPPPPPDPGTPSGSYNVIITATSPSKTSTTGLTLLVQ
jgi:hypothetical protein